MVIIKGDYVLPPFHSPQHKPFSESKVPSSNPTLVIFKLVRVTYEYLFENSK